jgi:hypothetical protein
MNFPDYLGHQCFRESDVTFYGFPSALGREQAMAYACEFRDAIDILQSTPQELMPHHVRTQRTEPTVYSSITFVAHSLGAPICRQALLDATIARTMWASRVRLLLFAPAHKGARALALRLLGLGCPVVRDLEEGSSFLNCLERDTLDQINSEGADHLIAKRVIFGSRDTLVNMTRFAKDHKITLIKDRGHRNICKPDSTYMQPLDELANLP